MCDCTGSVTHALSQRRAQRLVAAHHPKGVIVPGDAHQIARSRWEMLLFLYHTFNHLKKRPVSGTLLSVRRLAERWTASKGQLLLPCSYHFHAFPRVLPIKILVPLRVAPLLQKTTQLVEKVKPTQSNHVCQLKSEYNEGHTIGQSHPLKAFFNKP